jgi:hypothetical protein
VDDMELQRLENGGREGTSSLLKDSWPCEEGPHHVRFRHWCCGSWAIWKLKPNMMMVILIHSVVGVNMCIVLQQIDEQN